ncbi:MAG TPA: TonB-dependent receptor [Aliidongia sp.]|nr:TonB-dependent receptor [Aliidongia sp.]
MLRVKYAGAVFLYGATVTAALAQSANDTPTEHIEVIGIAPLPGSSIDPDKLPSNSQTLGAKDLTREGEASLIRAANDSLGSVSINDDLNDPFQPDILYRGFVASPVLGSSEGLAVYQNGVRINEAFGDTVNWDLFPDIAINRITIQGSNPVFGLNALGGAVTIEMKNGFNYHGGEAEISGGSFGRRSFSLQYGAEAGNFSTYVAGRVLNEDGWRDFSPDSVQQFYADLAARSDRGQIDISFTGANNLLQGQGATPVQELAIDRASIFTSPQSFRNQLYFVAINGSYDVTDALKLQSNFYYREFRQTIANGNTTDDEACDDGSGLCDSAGNPLIGNGGKQIPDISQGGTIPIGENDQNETRTISLGGSVQGTYTAAIFGRENHFVLGASIDHAATDYQAFAELGTVSPQLVIGSSGFFVDEPDSSSGPVNLNTTNNYYGLYFTDTFNLTPELAITASGRFNLAQVHLMDRLGTDLNGNARYSRFNPAIGATYKVLPNMTFYAGYSEANRAPTAGELACSNPEKPCILPAFLSSDPPNLQQVVAHTYETGLRGNFKLPADLPGGFDWKLGFFRTDLDDDIISVTTPDSLNEGFFQNVGATRRQGVEASLGYRDESWSVYANYSLVDATYQSSFLVPSASPAADENGNVQIHSGDHIPGVPQHRIKAGADYRITPAWTFGGSLNYLSEQYYANDFSNQEPQLPGHVTVNLHSTYEITKDLTVFVELENAFDAHYSTFGTFGDPTGVNAPGVPTNGVGVDPRFQSPAAPIAAFGGVRFRF